jgi:hypothetical protein
MEQEIQKKVIKIANDMSDQIVEQTGIRSSRRRGCKRVFE